MSPFAESAYQTILSSPPLLLALVALPLVALGYGQRIFPGRAMVALLILPCALSTALFWKRDVLPLLASVDVVLVLLAVWDLVSLPRKGDLTISRETPRIASLRKSHPVSLTIANRAQRDHVVSVRDGMPADFTADQDWDAVQLPRQSRVTLQYRMQCPRRGAHRMKIVSIRAKSHYGLWRRFLDYDVVNELHVYPDMQQLSKYALLARTNRLSLMGVRRQRRIGQDNEFERLRDFTRDDQYKHIDWRSTARRHKLTVRDFQANQSQRVVFLIDCGRMMVNQAEDLTLLDHALNAMLMLSYVALRAGDAVGALAFSDQIHAYVPPRGGLHQMNRLLHASFDKFPQLVESRYDQAFFHLSRRCRKRSLVILITNVIDEVNSTQIKNYLGSAAGHHLPLCVLLRDRRMFDAAERPLQNDDDLFVSAAAAGILTWRRQVLNQLEHQGVLVLDQYPEQITAPLVNRYLDIKARHLL